MRKFFGNILIVTGLVYATWALFGGGIDYYPNLNRMQEDFGMEFLNLISNLAVVSVSLILGFVMLLQSRLKGE